MSTFWTPNTLPDKKKILQCLLRLLFAPCLWFLAKGYYFLVPQNFAPCLQNYKQSNNILSPSSQEMEKKNPKNKPNPYCRLVCYSLVWADSEVPYLHCHPSNSPTTGGSYRSKFRWCQRTTKFGKGNGGYSHCLLLGQHPFGGQHWEGAFYPGTERWDSSYHYDQDEDSSTKTYIQTWIKRASFPHPH